MILFCYYIDIKKRGEIMITTTLRIEEELYNEISKIAEEEERSINSQIIKILKKFVEQQKKED